MSTLFAGSRSASGYVDDFGTNARFEYPVSLEADDNFLYVVEMVGERVRRIDPYTKEVTTAATLPFGSAPYGIYRVPASGNFYVACPGRRTIEVYDAAWAGIASIPTAGYAPPTIRNQVVFFVHVDDSETILWTGGYTADPPAASSDKNFGARVVEYDLATFSLLNAHLHNTYDNLGGIVSIGGDLYWAIQRFDNGIYHSTFSLGSRTLLAATNDSVRQLHRDPNNSNLVNFSCGPSEYSGSPFANIGARVIDVTTGTITDPAPGDHTPGQHECDYLVAFGAKFVVCSNVAMPTSEFEWATHTPSEHCVEVFGTPPRPPYPPFEYHWRWPAFGKVVADAGR